MVLNLLGVAMHLFRTLTSNRFRTLTSNNFRTLTSNSGCTLLTLSSDPLTLSWRFASFPSFPLPTVTVTQSCTDGVGPACAEGAEPEEGEEEPATLFVEGGKGGAHLVALGDHGSTAALPVVDAPDVSRLEQTYNCFSVSASLSAPEPVPAATPPRPSAYGSAVAASSRRPDPNPFLLSHTASILSSLFREHGRWAID